jgi:hypothetical protein
MKSIKTEKKDQQKQPVVLSEKNVRKIIREEFLHGIPDFALKQATETFVDDIRRSMKRFIMSNKSKNKQEQKQAFQAAEQALDSLENKVNDLLDEHLYIFIRDI